MSEKEDLKSLISQVEKAIEKVKEFLKDKEIKSIQEKKKDVFYSDA